MTSKTLLKMASVVAQTMNFAIAEGLGYNMKNIKLKISGMDCASCSNDIEKIFKKKDGIKINVSFITESAFVSFDEDK